MTLNNIQNSLNIISWNAQSIVDKHHELELFLHKESVDIALIQESKINKKQPPKIKGFSVLNKPNGLHNGLLIYYKSKYIIDVLDINAETFDIQGIKLDNLFIYNIYKPTSKNIDIQEIQNILNNKNPCTVIGDFNSRHKQWLCNSSNKSGTAIQKLLNNNKFIQSFPSNNPTHIPDNGNKPSVIDFAISNKHIIKNCISINALNSDHLPVKFKLSAGNIINQLSENIITKTNYNWPKYKKFLNNHITINKDINSTEKIDSEIHKLTSLIQTAIKKSSTITKINTNRPEIDPEITNLIKCRNKIRKVFQNNHDQQSHLLIKQLNAKIKIKMKEIKSDHWQNKIRKLCTKDNSLWSFTKRLINSNQDRSVYKLHGPGGIVYSDVDKANVLADQFQQSHRLTEHLSNRHTEAAVRAGYKAATQYPAPFPQNELATLAEVKSIIAKLKAGKAPGSDGVTNSAIKYLPQVGVVQLLHIFNASLKLKYFPSSWKEAIIIPILKPNKDKLFAVNYRPISLLPSLGKILEKIILNRLNRHEKQNKILIPEQFGFKANHNTVLQLGRIVDLATINFNLKNSTALLTLDIEKAFDTVWHKALIHKLNQYNFPNHLIEITNSFLRYRTYRVKINNKTLSNCCSIPAGVPQGAILSPFLFNIYVNDIPKSDKTQIALFADDTALIATSRNKTLANKYLQKHIDVLEDYYTSWKIKVNSTKTKLIYLSHKLDKPKTKLNSTMTKYKNKKHANTSD